MKYIIHKRFKGKAICGDVNLPAMTICECDGTIIKYNGSPIASWWERSPCCNGGFFYRVLTDGDATYGYAGYAYGFAPVFRV